jgi:hypothetical protein
MPAHRSCATMVAGISVRFTPRRPEALPERAY